MFALFTQTYARSLGKFLVPSCRHSAKVHSLRDNVAIGVNVATRAPAPATPEANRHSCAVSLQRIANACALVVVGGRARRRFLFEALEGDP